MRPGCVMACRLRLHSAPRTPHSALREVREGAPGRNRVVLARAALVRSMVTSTGTGDWRHE